MKRATSHDACSLSSLLSSLVILSCKCHGRFCLDRLSKLTSGPLYGTITLTGVTAMLTYASYLDRRTNLVQSGISIAMNISYHHGESAIFQPYQPLTSSLKRDQALFIVLNSLTSAEPFFHILFSCSSSFDHFFCRTCWKSMVSLIRITANVLIDVILGILTFVFGIPSALSCSVMADVLIFGKFFELWF